MTSYRVDVGSMSGACRVGLSPKVPEPAHPMASDCCAGECWLGLKQRLEHRVTHSVSTAVRSVQNVTKRMACSGRSPGFQLLRVTIGAAAVGNAHPFGLVEVFFQTVPAAFSPFTLLIVTDLLAVTAHRREFFIQGDFSLHILFHETGAMIYLSRTKSLP